MQPTFRLCTEPAEGLPRMLRKPNGKPTPEEKPSRHSTIRWLTPGAERAARGATSALREPHLEPLRLVLQDLQTPVAVLDACLRLLVEDLAAAPRDVQSTVRDAQRACRRIQQHVDQLVSSELLESGERKLHREQVDVGTLLSELADEYAHHAAAIGTRISTDLAPRHALTARADRSLLHRVLQNLFENALRHCGDGKSLFVGARGGSIVEVRICHDGLPIPRGDRERVFQKFPGLTSKRSASVGLYMCRLAMSAHGGTVTIEDDPHWPVCFVVRLPIASI